MIYRLLVLSHGQSETLLECVDSFFNYVHPIPVEGLLVYDGPWHKLPEPALELARTPGWRLANDHWGAQVGFCSATKAAWSYASDSTAIPWVFWLEHDFKFVREVDLENLAIVLAQRPKLAQMALMRQAVNEQEKAAGGLYEYHAAQGNYFEHYGWFEHRICLTTNPSLMASDFMRRNPWPEYKKECEGHFSGDLRDRGYTFGHWGSGEVYVEHIGQRTGFGY